MLHIDGSLVVNNDGLHGMRTKSGSKKLVGGQVHKTDVTFFERGGGAGLKVEPSVQHLLLRRRCCMGCPEDSRRTRTAITTSQNTSPA